MQRTSDTVPQERDRPRRGDCVRLDPVLFESRTIGLVIGQTGRGQTKRLLVDWPHDEITRVEPTSLVVIPDTVLDGDRAQRMWAQREWSDGRYADYLEATANSEPIDQKLIAHIRKLNDRDD